MVARGGAREEVEAEIAGVGDGDDRVDADQIAQLRAQKGQRDRQRVGDAAALDDEVVDFFGALQYPERRIDEVVVERAADATIAELDHVVAGGDGQFGVDPDFADLIDNDSTVRMLSDIALTHAQAGADVVAPSATMDGQVTSIRSSLDEHGYKKTKIMSYSAKHCSSLYSPFRSVAFSKQIRDYKSLDKSSYQIPFSNLRDSARKIENDILEGADMVIVKPAIMYLDIISMVKEKFGFPIAAQTVSGEYAMIKSAANNNWINENEWKVTSISAVKRAGADSIISYFCKDIAVLLDH